MGQKVIGPQQPLKIAVLLKNFVRSGGAERYAVELAGRLRDRGHYIHLFSRECDPGLVHDMTFHEVPNRLTFSSALNSFSFARETALLLKDVQFDVVHTHELGFYQDLSTVHTITYKGDLQRYSFIRRIDQKYLSYRSWIYHWLEKKQMNSPWLVSVSNFLRNDIEQNYKNANPVHVIPPGVDCDWFHPENIRERREAARRRANVGKEDVVVLFVGSEFKRKGLDLLIPAISNNMRLVIAGRGQHLSHYQNLARKCGVQHRMTLTGFVEGDIRDYYAAADIVVLPSLREAFGMTVLEGMACGIPVIVSARAGASLVVDHGYDGFIFEEQGQLKTCLNQLLDPNLREVMGQKARQKAEKYTWESVTSQYETLYRKIIDSKTNPT